MTLRSLTRKAFEADGGTERKGVNHESQRQANLKWLLHPIQRTRHTARLLVRTKGKKMSSGQSTPLGIGHSFMFAFFFFSLLSCKCVSLHPTIL
jgi:hypothetical protein